MAEVVLRDLSEVVDQIRVEVIERNTKRAQKQAWLSWRDRKQYPGLRHRFSRGTREQYGFSERDPRYTRRRVAGTSFWDRARSYVEKGALPPYVYTGRFRNSLLRRKPKTPRDSAGGMITTRFTIFGGVLNLLGADKQRGLLRWREEITREIRWRGPYTRRSRNGGQHIVRRHQFLYRSTEITSTPSPKTYAEEWAFQEGEVAWVRSEVDRVRQELLQKAVFTKKGKLKKSALARRIDMA